MHINEYSDQFNTFAEQFLNKQTLIINNKPYRICEIEFYYTSPDHPDPFTHKDPGQSKPDHWYFHKKGGTYKGGTYKGLDITFRPYITKYVPGNTIYGGILIRSIMNLEKNIFIEGPCKIVEEILKVCNQPHIKNFVDTYGTQINNHPMLKLIPNEHFNQKNIYRCPRVGLTLKQKDHINLRKYYIMQNYRYVIYPDLYKKYKNLIIANMLYHLQDNNEVCKLMKLTPKRLETIYPKIYPSSIPNFEHYISKDLKVDDLFNLCRLCHIKYKIHTSTEKIENIENLYEQFRNNTLSINLK